MSSHRICCCAEVDCADYCVTVTFTGVDASVCTDDCEVSTGTDSEDNHSIALDGTYTVPIWFPGITGIYIYTSTDGDFRDATHHDSNDCSGAGTASPGTFDNIDVYTDCSSGVVTVTRVVARGGTDDGSLTLYDSGIVTAAINSPISNSRSCGDDNGVIASGGTATVSVIGCP